MVANWHFNYESPAGAAAATHAPIAPPAPEPTPAPAPAPVSTPTNAPAVTTPEPLEKAPGTPLDAHPSATDNARAYHAKATGIKR